MALAGGVFGCAEGETEPQLFPLTVWNRCSLGADEPDFYRLEQVRVHEGPESTASDNELEPGVFLSVDQKTVLAFRTGYYVTAVRRRNEFQKLAMTTSEGLDVVDSCFLLEVFDSVFRLTRDDAHCVAMDGPPVDGDPTPGDGLGGD